MKKVLSVVALGLFLNVSAHAADADSLVCKQKGPEIAFGGTTVFTNIGQENMEVNLSFPKGGSYTATCASTVGAIEASYFCNVFTSTDSGYSVRLLSIGSSKLYASVQPWDMSGEGQVHALDCSPQE